MCTRIGPVADLEEERLISALRVNAGLPHGALAVVHDDLVMVEIRNLHSVDPEEMRPSIDDLARTADSYEKTLFGADVY